MIEKVSAGSIGCSRTDAVQAVLCIILADYSWIQCRSQWGFYKWQNVCDASIYLSSLSLLQMFCCDNIKRTKSEFVVEHVELTSDNLKAFRQFTNKVTGKALSVPENNDAFFGYKVWHGGKLMSTFSVINLTSNRIYWLMMCRPSNSHLPVSEASTVAFLTQSRRNVHVDMFVIFQTCLLKPPVNLLQRL